MSSSQSALEGEGALEEECQAEGLLVEVVEGFAAADQTNQCKLGLVAVSLEEVAVLGGQQEDHHQTWNHPETHMSRIIQTVPNVNYFEQEPALNLMCLHLQISFQDQNTDILKI